MEPISPREEHAVYELFKWSVLLKGLISVAEVIAGIALLLIPPQLFVPLVQGVGTYIASHIHASFIVKISEELIAFDHGAVLFASLYLLSRGLIKSVLVWALLRNISWAYPASLVVLGAFLIFQLYEIFVAGSAFVILITLFDIVVIYSIVREWKIVRTKAATAAS